MQKSSQLIKGVCKSVEKTSFSTIVYDKIPTSKTISSINTMYSYYTQLYRDTISCALKCFYFNKIETKLFFIGKNKLFVV